MAILPPPTSIDRIYNLLAIIANLFVLIISSILLCFILIRLKCFQSFQKKSSQTIPILLSMNTLSLLLIRSFLQMLDIDWNLIKRNYFSIMEYDNSFACQCRGYFLLSIHVALYWSYALHAFYRFIRVLYAKSNYFHRFSTYLYVMIPGQYTISFLTILPLFRGFNVIYLLPNEPYCTASYHELASLIYMPVVSFLLPISAICICYFSILWKTNRSKKAVRIVRPKHRRDRQVLHRIIVILAILNAVLLPLFVDLFLHLPKGHIDPHMNSIGWVASTFNAVILALSIPFINPHIYKLLRRRHQSHSLI